MAARFRSAWLVVRNPRGFKTGVQGVRGLSPKASSCVVCHVDLLGVSMDTNKYTE
ncbi:predicted protein [Histoplasma mississippiense (nom. inval.)]|uniref:predicted protein n=1 Tax=Ajellomyces capsulatus (strain NAm1 / WU24) TaxID=2059318 RepID=UPI000157D580|nr:predicted protein [Histoplasma mississippiense (nom. inval.)]EDN05317.1 predicted protein [Histoplasma mississippiense (nom. inval.)]